MSYWVYRAEETGSQKWLWEEEKRKRWTDYEYSSTLCHVNPLLQLSFIYLKKGSLVKNNAISYGSSTSSYLEVQECELKRIITDAWT